MRHDSESGRFVLCSERIVLECRCGEVIILLGQEEDWYSEGRTAFECECGNEVTLADHFDEEEPNFIGGFNEEAHSVRELLRNLRAANGR